MEQLSLSCDSVGYQIRKLFEQRLHIYRKQLESNVTTTPAQVHIPKAAYMCLICSDNVVLEKFAANIAFFNPGVAIDIFPAWDSLPYDRISPSQSVMNRRLEILSKIEEEQCATATIIITNMRAVIQRIMPKEILRNFATKLVKGQSIPRSLSKNGARETLQEALIEMGFVKMMNSSQTGEYSVRGSIIDIVTDNSGSGYRLDFFGDNIETIRVFDTSTQISGHYVDEVSIIPTNEVILNKQTIEIFKEKYLAKFGVTEDLLFEAIAHGSRYAGMENWLPLYYGHTDTFFSYLPKDTLVLFPEMLGADIATSEENIVKQYEYRAEVAKGRRDASYYPITPVELYLSADEVMRGIEAFQHVQYSPFATNSDSIIPIGRRFVVEAALEKKSVFEVFKDTVRMAPDKSHILCCYSRGSRDRIANFLTEHGINFIYIDNWQRINPSMLAVAVLPIDNGFAVEEQVFYSELDLFGERFVRPNVKKKKQQVFNEISTLAEGDLVVHIEHGIGRFEGLETLKINDAVHDLVKIVYAGNDKLYLPVENLDVLSRFGGEDAALDKLGSAGWQARKAKIKSRIKIAADSLLKVAAARELCHSEPIQVLSDLYEKFCSKFPYVETDDQLSAIEDIINDLKDDKPMDRLICGDVGYGKTEVALRAVCLVTMAQSHSQVAILVPTTLLARQHYKTFTERFADFPVRISQLSRFTPSSEIKKIKADIADGKIDIIVGTHALLAKDIKFANLKMIVIDEEQHFGVGQKEKLKEMRSNCHVLTLSATPIPRTLQMSLSGIRELSILATPPIDRLAIRSYVMPLDELTLREAILREIHRGGRVFYVTPRVAYIDNIIAFLAEIVPEAKVISAHGQLPPTRLDAVMNDFYDGKFDVLVSTTIVESGLDIPMANTIIIDRAYMFGLSQLYQIRGRVGRSNTQAYAYLTYPKSMRLNLLAEKRLTILQSLDSLGAGFSIASHDMDMRGYGNLVGEEQSGQIREIGIELYQQMLNDAILALKDNIGVVEKENWSPTLNIGGLSVQIPESYIPDAALRLSLYRRIASLNNEEELESFAAEMVDRFGKPPKEAEHLFAVVKLKALAKAANIEKIDLGDKALVISFKNSTPIEPDCVLDLIERSLGKAKLRPDGKVVLQITPADIMEKIAWLQQIIGKIIPNCIQNNSKIG